MNYNAVDLRRVFEKLGQDPISLTKEDAHVIQEWFSFLVGGYVVISSHALPDRAKLEISTILNKIREFRDT